MVRHGTEGAKASHFIERRRFTPMYLPFVYEITVVGPEHKIVHSSLDQGRRGGQRYGWIVIPVLYQGWVGTALMGCNGY